MDDTTKDGNDPRGGGPTGVDLGPQKGLGFRPLLHLISLIQTLFAGRVDAHTREVSEYTISVKPETANRASYVKTPLRETR